MIIGVPKEIKNHEYRVAIAPSGVRTLGNSGHRVVIQRSAGDGSGITDAEYIAAGAEIKQTASEIYRESDLILKVKEPQPEEYPFLRDGQVLFTYLHLAPAPELTRKLLELRIVGLAYETVQTEVGSLPLLIPSSEIAGKLSVQIGAHYLEKQNGGSGVLLGGVPGVQPANLTILGAGTVGANAARIALGMGANVSLIDISLDRLRYLSDIFKDRLTLLASNVENVEKAVPRADVVIGSVLAPGARTKKIVTRRMISEMRKGSVIVDVAIDQGGCFETSVPTSFDDPVFVVEGVIHYCVANIPSCVSRTATFALTNATFPYVLKLANMGLNEALDQDSALRRGVNVYKGKLTNKAVAEALGINFTPYEKALA